MNVWFLVCKTTSSILWINIINYKLWCVLWLIDCDWEKLVIWRTVTDRNMMVVGWPCVVDWMLKSKNWPKFLTVEWRVLPCSGLPGSAHSLFLCVQSCLCIHIYRHIYIYVIYPVVSSGAFFNNILQLFFHFQIVSHHMWSCPKRWPLQRLHHAWKEALGVGVV